jgi:tetratricopeptide (TPR) repeat protein
VDKGKKKGKFADLMDRARAALRAKRYEDAVAAVDAALQLVPGDLEAQQLRKDATKARRSAKAEYDRLMAQADAARAAGRFEEASRGYSDALQVMPDDDAATRGLRAVQGVAADVAAAQVAYQRYMNQGSLAMQNLQYAEALRSYAEALRLVPGDLVAAQGVRDARAALDVLAQKQIDFDAAMKRGNAALRARQFSDAVRAFSDAQRLIPDSPRATAGLQQARFSKAMSDGQAAFSARRFGDAVRAFEDALQEVPGDPTATSALRQARAMQRR